MNICAETAQAVPEDLAFIQDPLIQRITECRELEGTHKDDGVQLLWDWV